LAEGVAGAALEGAVAGVGYEDRGAADREEAAAQEEGGGAGAPIDRRVRLVRLLSKYSPKIPLCGALAPPLRCAVKVTV
jgi:hypothetical protein